MELNYVIEGVVGWCIALSLLYLFIRGNIHPSRKHLRAFVIFIATFFGIVFSGIALFVFCASLFNFDANNWAMALAGPLAIGLVIPAWSHAMKKIKTPVTGEV